MDTSWLPNPWQLVPTNVRLYAEGMLGAKSPVTNKDFSDDELAAMRSVVNTRAAKQAELARGLLTPEQYAVKPTIAVSGAPIPYDRYVEARMGAKGAPNPNRVAVQYEDYPTPIEQGTTANTVGQIYKTATDPAYRVATSLGRFVAHAQPDGGYQIEDMYHWHPAALGNRSVPQQLDLGLQGLGDLLATARNKLFTPIERPVRVTLPAPPSTAR